MLQQISKNTLAFLSTALVITGCQSAPKSVVSPEIRAVAVAEMTPHYECVLYHDQSDNSEGVTKSIDDAVTIGEGYGLSATESMAVFREVKAVQLEAVLERALKISSNREGAIPRINGGPPKPNSAEELQAWEELYGSGC